MLPDYCPREQPPLLVIGRIDAIASGLLERLGIRQNMMIGKLVAFETNSPWQKKGGGVLFGVWRRRRAPGRASTSRIRK